MHIEMMMVGLFGGLALFLYGMGEMTESLHMVAGSRARSFLSCLTSNRFSATLAGFLMTAITQSCSVTTVLLVGVISAGLINLSQGIGIILGANIGATLTVQIIAFKVTKYALVLIMGGVIARALSSGGTARNYCSFIIGIGLVLYGMDLMSTSMFPIREYGPFLSLIEGLSSPIYGVLMGCMLTAVIRSSTATIGIVMVLASHGMVGLTLSIALVFGANIGTCVTALISSIGKPREAIQSAVAHLLFNVIGTIMWFPLLSPFEEFVRYISPEDIFRQIANAHTVFNTATALVFLPMTGVLSWMARQVVPSDSAGSPKKTYLDEIYLDQAGLALERARMELGLMGKQAMRMVNRSWEVSTDGTGDDLLALERMDDETDRMYDGMVSFLGSLSMKKLSRGEADLSRKYMAAANHIEGICDIVEMDIVSVGRRRVERGLKISEGTRKIIRPVYDTSRCAMLHAMKDKDGKRGLSRKKMRGLADVAHGHLSERLVADAPNRMATFKMESDMVEAFCKIHDLAVRLSHILHDGPENIKIIR